MDQMRTSNWNRTARYTSLGRTSISQISKDSFQILQQINNRFCRLCVSGKQPNFHQLLAKFNRPMEISINTIVTESTSTSLSEILSQSHLTDTETYSVPGCTKVGELFSIRMEPEGETRFQEDFTVSTPPPTHSDIRSVKSSDTSVPLFKNVQIMTKNSFLISKSVPQRTQKGPNFNAVELAIHPNRQISHLQRMENLIFLDLSNNQLNSICGLNDLVSLRVLLLPKNHIRRIQGLDQLLKLEVLDLHQNHIRRIENLAHLTRLRLLNLASNKIVFVNGLSGMQSLTELNLRHNQIVQIEPMLNLPSLAWIFLSTNKIERSKYETVR
ncbi:hypothetical protein AHF37_10661 [Paragonimus kellicotti]|nr:hypothetical protein AHF37_10661 [Paragonimus kellicotti]